MPSSRRSLVPCSGSHSRSWHRCGSASHRLAFLVQRLWPGVWSSGDLPAAPAVVLGLPKRYHQTGPQLRVALTKRTPTRSALVIRRSGKWGRGSSYFQSSDSRHEASWHPPARTSEAPSTPNSLQHSRGHGVLRHSIRDAIAMKTTGGPAVWLHVHTCRPRTGCQVCKFRCPRCRCELQ